MKGRTKEGGARGLARSQQGEGEGERGEAYLQWGWVSAPRCSLRLDWKR